MGCGMMVVGAHPDDAELGVGGIIATSVDTGMEVVILDVTAGEMATDVSPEDRARDADRATAVLGVRRQCLGLADRGLVIDDDSLQLCVHAVRQWVPEVVLLPDPGDRHPDHGMVYEMFRQALFSSGLARFGRGEPHRPRRVYTYGVSPGVAPDTVVDVTAGYERKLQALSSYRHLGDVRWTESASGQLSLILARDRYYGSLIGVQYGEAVRAVGVTVLRQL